MTAFVLSADTNIDALASKAGGDTYNTNGWLLTIDQDSRVGANQTTGATLGSITVNATKGGGLLIDGTGIWMIPYTGGSGNVPAWNTAITNGSGTGKLIAVHASLTSNSTATGSAMPATGFIRVKQKSGAYTAGALTGITATASDAGRVGWLEVVGDEAATINANRLGTVDITGEWYALGTTSGAANQTLQVPNNGVQRYVAGVFIEKTAGLEDYEFYPNAGTAMTVGNEAARGKVVWINNAGLVRIGHNGTANMGYVPASGLAVVVPNIFLENALTASRSVNTIPNATVATRYDFTSTGGGVINISKANMAWYGSFTQPYSVTLTDCCFIDAILIAKVASPLTWSRVGVGSKPTTELATPALTMTACTEGGTMTDCVWSRASLATSNQYITSLADSSDFSFVDNVFRANTNRANATVYAVLASRMTDCEWVSPILVGAGINLGGCIDPVVTDTAYIDGASGTTSTALGTYVWTLSTAGVGAVISGLSLPVTNNHPYLALLFITAAGVRNTKLRNIGTRSTPLSLGSANACGQAYAINSAAAAQGVVVQRVYVSNTRSNFGTGDNSNSDVIEESCFGDYGDTTGLMNALNFVSKGYGGTPTLTAQTAVYGTHWRDCFTSTTAGRINIVMNEPTAKTAAQVSLSGGAAFTSTGGLYMPVIGQSATFTMPYYALGHLGVSALTMAGGTAANYTYRYQIDRNDGNGFSAWSGSETSATINAALAAEAAFDASLGVKIKLEITTGTTNSTAITSVYLTTSSSTTAQDYQYPLDVNTVTFTGLPTGTDIVVLTAGTSTILAQQDANPTTSYAFTYSGAQNVDVGFINPGYQINYLRNLPLGTTDSSIPVSLTADRNYA